MSICSYSSLSQLLLVLDLIFHQTLRYFELPHNEDSIYDTVLKCFVPPFQLRFNMGNSTYDCWTLSIIRFLCLLALLRIDMYQFGRGNKERGASWLVGTSSLLIATMIYMVFKMLTRLILGPGGDSVTQMPSIYFFRINIGVSMLSILFEMMTLYPCFAGSKRIYSSVKPNSVVNNESLLKTPLIDVEKASVNHYQQGHANKQAATSSSIISQKQLIDDGAPSEDGINDIESEDIKYTKILGVLMKLVWADKVILFGALICLLIAACGEVGIPHFTGLVIESAIHRNDEKFFQYLFYLSIASVFASLFAGIRGALFTILMARQTINIRRQLLEGLFSLPASFFDVNKTGELISRLISDTSSLSNGVGLNLNVFFRSLVQAIGVLIFMFFQEWRLALVSLISVPLVALVTQVYGRWFAHFEKECQAHVAAASSIAEESLGSMSTIRSLNGEKCQLSSFQNKLNDYLNNRYQTAYSYVGYTGSTSLLPNIVTIILLYYGGKLTVRSELSSSTLISFMLFQQSLANSFNTMGWVFTRLASTIGATNKVMQLIELSKKPAKEGGAIQFGNVKIPPGKFQGNLSFHDVWFSYPARPSEIILRGISFDIKAGQSVALVGPSGSGKSSCIRLIERFYSLSSHDIDQNVSNVCNGSILLDGCPLNVFDPEWYHSRIAMVGQEPVIYGRSIAQNIFFGMSDADADDAVAIEDLDMMKVIEAAKTANAHDFIMKLNNQYMTNVGDKGVQLSGGQKQRIAIARALIRRPSILLLDEATSALDSESESIVQEAIDNIIQKKSCTVIVVAHRLSTIRNSDLILVMNQGQVVESGTHETLLKFPSSLYATLVKTQLN